MSIQISHGPNLRQRGRQTGFFIKEERLYKKSLKVISYIEVQITYSVFELSRV